MEIRFATVSDAPLISSFAQEVWPQTYSGILSDEQIKSMLADFYTNHAIEGQMERGHQFILLEKGGVMQGFASVSKKDDKLCKLEKLYVHPRVHKQGGGRFLMNAVEDCCKQQGVFELILNVNRNNNAKLFYFRMGFAVIEEVDIPYRQFVLNDYVMGKVLKP